MFFSFFTTGREFKKIKKQFAELAFTIQVLQSQLDEMRQESRDNINIENVYVERINVDRLEFSNNFGAMGVRELGGTLNIGVNYLDEKIRPGRGKTPPGEGRVTGEPSIKQQPSPGGRTDGPRREQENPAKAFSNKTRAKKNHPDDLNNSPGVGKEVPADKKQPKHRKDSNKTIKSPKKRVLPVCNLFYGERGGEHPSRRE